MDGTINGTASSADFILNNNASLGYRQPNKSYSVGNIAYHSNLPTGWYLECTTAGTSSSGDLTISSPTVGGTVTDGTVVWTVMKNLPLSGGAMTGSVISRDVDHNYLILRAGTDSNKGSEVLMAGKDVTGDDPGMMYIRACNGISSNLLLMLSNGGVQLRTTERIGETGTVTRDLAGAAIVAKSLGTNGYIKYASGLIVQWGTISNTPNGESGTVITFPISFTSTNITVVATLSSSNSGESGYIRLVELSTKTTTSFKAWVKRVTSGSSISYETTKDFNWIAIGY